MELNYYQSEAKKTAIYPKDKGIEYCSIALAGEVGETLNIIKKSIRDDNGVISKEKLEELTLELGDCLWYLASLSSELGLSLNTIAEKNLDKLAKRVKKEI
ncbi:MAG: MazG nucleotide pyrophosphohydrolase domain-containing protein [Microcoleaceae cyanobacterium MO_207.B10]|nr:MazG nucleotide pyrophosphohydrolase domain-containing protein [Microcoleaceae cyanobacterium MO_207.B10]